MAQIDTVLAEAVSQARARGIEYTPERIARARQRLQARFGGEEAGRTAAPAAAAVAAPAATPARQFSPERLRTAEIVVETANRHGVDPILVSSMINQESGGRHYDASGRVLTSPAGARGVMQLMPGTASGLGVDPDDLSQNIDGGVRYLKQQLDAFGGDVPKALAAYNAGPGAVERYRGVPPYHETVNYVSSVMARYNRYTNGGGGAASAPASGLPAAPQGPAAPAVPIPAAAPAAPQTRTYTVAGYHAVKSGETLGAIATRYGSTVQDMADMNQITDPNRINVGQSLMIPGGQGGPRRQQQTVTVPVRVGQAFVRQAERAGMVTPDAPVQENPYQYGAAAAQQPMRRDVLGESTRQGFSGRVGTVLEDFALAIDQGEIRGASAIAKTLRVLGVSDPRLDSFIATADEFGDYLSPTQLTQASYAGKLTAEALSTIAQSATAGAGGLAVGTVAGGPAGAVLGLGLGAGTVFGMSTYDDTYRDLKSRGIDEDTARDTAFWNGVSEGATEFAGDVIAFGLMGKLVGVAGKSLIRAIPTAMAQGALSEGIGEGMNAYIQTRNLNKAGVQTDMTPTEAAWEAFKNAAQIGAVIPLPGASMSIGREIQQRVQQRSQEAEMFRHYNQQQEQEEQMWQQHEGEQTITTRTPPSPPRPPAPPASPGASAAVTDLRTAPVTDEQRTALREIGHQDLEIDGMNRAEAGAVITRQMDQPTAHTVQNQAEIENSRPQVSNNATPAADRLYNQAGITETPAQQRARQDHEEYLRVSAEYSADEDAYHAAHSAAVEERFAAQQRLTAEDHAAINAITSPEMLTAARADAMARGDVSYAAVIDEKIDRMHRPSHIIDYIDGLRRYLQNRVNGLKSSDILSLGRPKRILQASGIINNDMQLTQSVIRKAESEMHGVDFSELENLAEAINDPIFVMTSLTHPKTSKVVFTNVPSRDGNILVAVEMSKNRDSVQINDITSIYGKDTGKVQRWLTMNGNKFTYMNEKKGHEWMAATQGSNSPRNQSIMAAINSIAQNLKKSRPFNGQRGEISMELLIPPPVARALKAIRDGVGKVRDHVIEIGKSIYRSGQKLGEFAKELRKVLGDLWAKAGKYTSSAYYAAREWFKNHPPGLTTEYKNADGTPVTEKQLREADKATQEIAKRQQRLEERALGRIDTENATLAEYENAIREIRQQVAGKEGETAARVAQQAARQAEKSAAFAKGALAAAPKASPAIRKQAAAIIASERNAKKAGNEVAEHLLTTMMETHRQEQENVGKAIAAARKRVDPEHLGKVLNDVARATTLEKVADLVAKSERVQHQADQRQEAKKIVDDFKKTMAKISAGKLKAIDPQYQLRIRDLLSQFDLKAGFRGLSEAKEHDLRSLLTVINKNGIPFGIDNATLRELERLNKRSLGEMTHDEMVFLHQNFQQIMALGELKKQLRARQVERIRQEELGKLLASTKNMDYLNPDSPKLEERANWIKRQAADLTFGLRYTDTLDGGKKYQGENTRMLRQLGEAVNRGEMEANTVFVETLDKLKAIDPELSIDTETAEQRKFWATITFYMMVDQPKPLWEQAQKLISYYDLPKEITTTPPTPQQRRIIDTLRGGFNGIGPRVRAVEMEIHGELFGLNPKYFPLKYRDYSPYDTKLTGTQASFYDRLRESIGQTVPKQQTPFSGFTFGRIPGVKKVPRIDLIGVMYEGLGEQLHYVNTEPVLFRTKHLVLSEEYHQKAGSNAIHWWTEQLNIIAQRGRTENYQGNKIIQWLRGNVSRAILHYKATTILLQPTAAFDAIVLATSLYGEKAGRQVAAEVARAFASPKATDAFITQHPDLTLRRGMAGEDIMREINTERSSRGEKPSLGGRMISFGDIITAAGAQRAFIRILSENGAKDPAAEAALLMSVANSTNNYAYRPQILSRGDLQKALLMFQSFGLNRAQLIIDDIINKGVVQSARRGEWSKALTSMYALVQMEAGIVSELVVRKGIKYVIGAMVGLGLAAVGLDGGDDDDREWMNIENLVKANISTVPWFGDIINSAYDAGVKGYARDVDNPIVRLINNTARGAFFLGKVAFGEKEQSNRRIALGMIDLLEGGAALVGVAGTIQMGEIARSITRQSMPAREESPRKTARAEIMDGLRAGQPMTAEIAAAREAGYIARSTKLETLRAEAMQPEPVAHIHGLPIAKAIAYWAEADDAGKKQMAEEINAKLARADLPPETRKRYVEMLGTYYRPPATSRFRTTGAPGGGRRAARFGGSGTARGGRRARRFGGSAD